MIGRSDYQLDLVGGKSCAELRVPGGLETVLCGVTLFYIVEPAHKCAV